MTAMTTNVLRASVRALYSMLDDELARADYTDGERGLLQDPVMYYGRFLDPRTRPYALHVVARNLSRAARELGLPGPRHILDIGCGLGNPAFLLATLGAKVHGVDLDPRCVSLAEKRRAYYTTRCGPIDATFQSGDFLAVARDLPSESLDAVFSYSSFIYIQPTSEVVQAIARLLRPGGRVVIWDNNPGHLGNRLRGHLRALPRPGQVRELFESSGVTVHRLAGGTVVPWFMWHPAIAWIDHLATAVPALGFNFLLAGRKD